jgi:protein TonB
MNKILMIICFFISAKVLGQDTIYYDLNFNKVKSLNTAKYYDIIQHDKNDTNRAISKIYFKSGKIRNEKSYSSFSKKQLDGKIRAWDTTGQIRKDIDYKGGKINGKVITYWKNGKQKRNDTFENDKFISGKCWDKNGNEIPHTDFIKMPNYAGGQDALSRYLKKKIKYPRKARRKGIEGIVQISFIVNKDGSITEVKIKEGINDILDKKVMRVVEKMPKWEAGTHDGEAVRMRMVLPIHFNLIDM